MNEHADQIRNAFESHEHLAPDSVAVLARAQELAVTYRRRRLGAQAAGGAVLGAGLLAGGIGLPSLLAGGNQAKVVQAPAAQGGTAPTVPVQTPAQQKRDLDAYFAAGYDLASAEKLAKIWQLSTKPAELDVTKVEAGRRLLAGENLPVRPNPANVEDAKKTRAAEAFFAAGYDIADAKRLARLWKTDDAYGAKVLGGQKILAGKKLPFEP
jgi:hypothetical protein